MSRIGKKPIHIPDGVTVSKESNVILVKGPKGELKRQVRDDVISFDFKGKEVILNATKEGAGARSLWGTYASHIKNMIQGVTVGFEKILEIEGIGFKVELKGNDLILNLGFSHPVMVSALEGINFKVEKNVITVSGIDKEAVGEMAARIRAIKKPEPYKGKGIRYRGEVVRRKAGKKAAVSG
ncbi:MAG: 50S ribosomal protein L6 [Candidatus Niyogibacteria bacterium CG10_big_fil_rev_8_21_14_0_10_42_19]|uniref:Large ribosomal subunit protein uL6 n=1 Tax=Candidatus Niyogibacteria bacterium CG10_big_fil_rev_8_21_14_0_10_42_19 TaxID=1974725 RepID=A0A2H0TFC3_9BACT|nr:MAG: 50S ribosomal protein L6 [Candidatus Niyogibacteria bacterium CG10_big_fil_rev_8_21_14_0_10_42_19]